MRVSSYPFAPLRSGAVDPAAKDRGDSGPSPFGFGTVREDGEGTGGFELSPELDEAAKQVVREKGSPQERLAAARPVRAAALAPAEPSGADRAAAAAASRTEVQARVDVAAEGQSLSEARIEAAYHQHADGGANCAFCSAGDDAAARSL